MVAALVLRPKYAQKHGTWPPRTAPQEDPNLLHVEREMPTWHRGSDWQADAPRPGRSAGEKGGKKEIARAEGGRRNRASDQYEMALC